MSELLYFLDSSDCQCNPHGVLDNDLTCESDSLQCNCECYVIGQHCDTCKKGHFNFTTTPPCEHGMYI